MSAVAIVRLSVEEYLALDRAAERHSEYHDGEMFPVVLSSLAHSLIQANTLHCLIVSLRGTPCRVAGPLRVRVSPSKYVYPDVLVYCGKPVTTDDQTDTITNPKVIVEILSPSTEDYDYGKKFVAYRALVSFQEYLLISQDKPRVEVFRKMPDERWVLTTFEGLNAVVAVESLAISIPMSDLYNGVEFPAAVSA